MEDRDDSGIVGLILMAFLAVMIAVLFLVAG